MPRLSQFFACLCFLLFATVTTAQDRLPNIVLIYADDLGYGDVGCYGATGIPTPNIDKLAAEGLRFTDGHCSAATCTPSRYSLLTGDYAFRNPKAHILPGDAAMIIRPGQETLASLLKKAGYTTAVVGKWHLGLGNGKVDWNGDIKPGPLEIGFDYSFLIPATGDRVPCVYVENHRVVGLDPNDPITVSYAQQVGDDPTGRERPDLLKMKFSHGHDRTIVHGISRIGYMTGGQAARWKDADMADDITRPAVKFIEENKDQPFFLYFSTHDIHVPRYPHERFRGKSESSYRGDAVVQLDWCTGELMKAVERLGLTNDTLFIFTSDNGPVLDDGYVDEAVAKLGDHKPAGPLRGGKYSRYEGGTRVPLIVRWPGEVTASTTSNALMSQVDFLASFAALTKVELAQGAGQDSENQLPALLGKSEQGRELLVEQANGLALRKENWKFIEGGGNKQRPQNKAGTEQAVGGELYDLSNDLGERNNLINERPKLAQEMQALLDKIRANEQ